VQILGVSAISCLKMPRRFDILAGSIYLTGWWQSYWYFENAADPVRSFSNVGGLGLARLRCACQSLGPAQ